MNALPDSIPAATLVLMRTGAGGAPEVLMIERTRTMAFAAGALVFPGGRIDADDHVVAERFGPELDHAAGRVAAIRETIEETGIAPAFVAPAPPATISQLRQELEDGTPFSALLEHHRLSLDLSSLVPFARWCPNFKEARRFDTLFFVARAPQDAAEPRPAEAEAVRSLWVPAAQVLDDANCGRARIIFPTRRNLERLSLFSSFEEARADAERRPVRKVVPWIEDREGTQWLCIPDDLGYPVTAERLETARRS
ncbi:MAG: NUDIX domain-containing protein [Pseudomonadota bacterium]|nr:NUDIX domain-containing protein [Pseudomonadota bacterium]